jgi:hypothetical protein
MQQRRQLQILVFVTILALLGGQALAGATFGIKLPLSISNATLLPNGLSFPELELGYESAVAGGQWGVRGSVFFLFVYGHFQADAYYRPQSSNDRSTYFGAGVGLEYAVLGQYRYHLHGLAGMDFASGWCLESTAGVSEGQDQAQAEALRLMPSTSTPDPRPPTVAVAVGPSFYLRLAGGFRFR